MKNHTGLNDVKHVTAASAADEYSDDDDLAPARGMVNGLVMAVILWAAVGIAVFTLVGGGYVWGEDIAIERLQDKQSEVLRHQLALDSRVADAYRDGQLAGRSSVMCLGGFAVDRDTGKLLEARR